MLRRPTNAVGCGRGCLGVGGAAAGCRIPGYRLVASGLPGCCARPRRSGGPPAGGGLRPGVAVRYSVLCGARGVGGPVPGAAAMAGPGWPSGATLRRWRRSDLPGVRLVGTRVAGAMVAADDCAVVGRRHLDATRGRCRNVALRRLPLGAPRDESGGGSAGRDCLLGGCDRAVVHDGRHLCCRAPMAARRQSRQPVGPVDPSGACGGRWLWCPSP